MNPVVHVEIPVVDLARAMRFYSAVFGVTFGDVVGIHDNQMAYFPFETDKEGASVALAQGAVYVPTLAGAVVYFAVEDIDAAIAVASQNGGKCLFPKTVVDENCWVAEICDSEGNRIALQTM